MKRGISPNNTKHKQKASILVSTSIVQISSITSEQSPEDFCFEIIGIDFEASECRLGVNSKVNKE